MYILSTNYSTSAPGVLEHRNNKIIIPYETNKAPLYYSIQGLYK